jgi:hypothetical protein
MLSPVSALTEPIQVRIVDRYGDGTVWFSLEDPEGRRATCCIDGRAGSVTQNRLFDGGRHPRIPSVRLIELGDPEEGIVIPLISLWLDSAPPSELGLHEYYWELIRDALLNLGEPPTQVTD